MPDVTVLSMVDVQTKQKENSEKETSLGLEEKMKMTEKEILDVEQLRMGGSYLKEMKQLRSEGADIERIEEFFLQKDLQTELEERRRKERENRMKEKTDEMRGKVFQL